MIYFLEIFSQNLKLFGQKSLFSVRSMLILQKKICKKFQFLWKTSDPSDPWIFYSWPVWPATFFPLTRRPVGKLLADPWPDPTRGIFKFADPTRPGPWKIYYYPTRPDPWRPAASLVLNKAVIKRNIFLSYKHIKDLKTSEIVFFLLFIQCTKSRQSKFSSNLLYL